MGLCKPLLRINATRLVITIVIYAVGWVASATMGEKIVIVFPITPIKLQTRP
jgi:hypothetical protein